VSSEALAEYRLFLRLRELIEEFGGHPYLTIMLQVVKRDLTAAAIIHEFVFVDELLNSTIGKYAPAEQPWAGADSVAYLCTASRSVEGERWRYPDVVDERIAGETHS
jgi:hypothetical protein